MAKYWSVLVALVAMVTGCGSTAEESEVLVGRPPGDLHGGLNIDDAAIAAEKAAAAKRPNEDAAPAKVVSDPIGDPLHFDGERSLSRVTEIAIAGTATAPSFGPDGAKLLFAARRQDSTCNALFAVAVTGGTTSRVSPGDWDASSGALSGDGLLYASSRLSGAQCAPLSPEWHVLPSSEIFSLQDGASEPVRLTKSKGYDGEPAISPAGDQIVFASGRRGDIDIYAMTSDGKRVRRLTKSKGFDGGPAFSPDGGRIAFHGDHRSGKAAAAAKKLLKKGLVQADAMEIYIMDAGGKGLRQITHMGAASFAPVWQPDGKHILFTSNMHDPDHANTDLYLIADDGSDLRRVTFGPGYDGLGAFSPDGHMIAFVSTRGATADTRLFVANWRD